MFDDTSTSSDSPKIRWLKKHNLTIAKDILPRSDLGPFNIKPFRCSNPARTVNFYGKTEEEAIWAACEGLGIKHWLVE